MKKKFKKYVVKSNPESASVKHVVGRHALITLKEQQQHNLTESAKEIFSKIFQHQSTSTLHTWLENISCDPLKSCCDIEYNHLKVNFSSICELSRMDYKWWQRERKNRITGSRCYEIYTYTFNKTPDWVKKCSKFFNIKILFSGSSSYKYGVERRQALNLKSRLSNVGDTEVNPESSGPLW